MKKPNESNQRMDKSIDEVRKLNAELLDEDSLYYRKEEEEQKDVSIEDTDGDSDKKDSIKSQDRKRFYLFWIIVLLVTPPPLGFIILKVNHVKLKWYHYLLIGNVFGFLGIVIFATCVMLPLQARLYTQSTLAKNIFVKYNLAEYYEMDSPDLSFNFQAGSQSSNPTYEGGFAIDYDKLETLYPGDTLAKVRAQRYQLYSEIEEMFGVSKLILYNIEGQESTSHEVEFISDLYKCYTRSMLGSMTSEKNSGFSQAVGPFQISSASKHIPLMFESKYSTRTANTDTSVYAFHRLSNNNTSRSASADGIAYYDRFKGKEANPDFTFKQTYDPNTDDIPALMATMSENIALHEDQGDFSARVLTVEGSKNYIAIRGITTSNMNSFISPETRLAYSHSQVWNDFEEAQTPMLLRFNAYYYPDAAASTAFDVIWVTNTLTNSVNGDNGNQRLIVTEDRLNTKMQKSDKTYKEYYLAMAESQRLEIGALLLCAWFNSVPRPDLLDDLFATSMEIIAEFGSTLNWENAYKNGSNTYTLFKKDDEGKFVSIYGKMNDMWYNIPGGYGYSKTDGGGYGYTFKQLGQGLVPMDTDRRIFEDVRIEDSNGNGGNGNSSGYSEIKAITWEEASKLFPRLDSGGPVNMECIDVKTGKEFTLIRSVGSNHADVETATAKDTAILKEAIGGSWNWVRRPILIKGANGILYAASLAPYPHAGEDNKEGSGSNLDYIKGNDMDGVMDLHFRGSKSHVDADAGITVATENADHQKAIDEALQATKYVNDEKYSNGNATEIGPIYDFTDYYPPVLNKFARTEQVFHKAHRGVDVVIDADTLKNVSFKSDDIYSDATTPIIKIHSATAGKVLYKRCHAYPVTSSKTGPVAEWSDHKNGTINRRREGSKYPEYAKYNVTEGDCIGIQGVDGKIYWYMHMYCGSQTVEVGDTVVAGQVLGYMGNTGQTYSDKGGSAIHLHFQIGQGDGAENGEPITKLGYGLADN